MVNTNSLNSTLLQLYVVQFVFVALYNRLIKTKEAISYEHRKILCRGNCKRVCA